MKIFFAAILIKIKGSATEDKEVRFIYYSVGSKEINKSDPLFFDPFFYPFF